MGLLWQKTGAIADALRMDLFDLISGWGIWAPFTFIIVGAMGFVVGLISENATGNKVLVCGLAIASALIIKVVGTFM